MADYAKDLAEFLDAHAQDQREMQTRDRIIEIAARRHKPVHEMSKIFDRLERNIRGCGGATTRDELVNTAWSKGR